MRTTIELPDPLFRVAKTMATEKGISLKAFFTEALKNAVTTPEAASQRMEQPPISGTGKNRIPARSNAELADLLLEEDLAKAR